MFPSALLQMPYEAWCLGTQNPQPETTIAEGSSAHFRVS